MLYRASLIFFCLVLGLMARVSNYEFFLSDLSGGHLNFFDTDSYYHLRRFVYFLNHFPDPLWRDPLVNWPTGSVVPWPEGFLFLYGIPLKLLGLESLRQIEWGVTFINLFLGLCFAALVYYTSRFFIREWSLRLFVLFFMSLNFLMVRFSALGALDHHLLEAMFPILFFLVGRKLFFEEKSKRPLFLGAVLSVLISFSLLVSSSSIFAIGALFLWVILMGRHPLRVTGVGLFAALLLVPYVWIRYLALNEWISLSSPSGFQIALLVLLSLCVGVWSVLSPRGKGWAIAGSLSLPILSLLLNWPTWFAGNLKAAFSYVFVKGGVLGQVQEVQFLFTSFDGFDGSFMHLNFSYLIYLLPFAWIVGLAVLSGSLFKSVRRWMSSFEATDLHLIFWTCMISIPAVFQKRFSHLLIGFFALFVAWCLERLCLWLREHHRRLVPLVQLFAVCMVIFPSLGMGFAPSGSPRDFVDLGSISFFSSVKEVKEVEVIDRLSLKTPATAGALVHPNVGHAFLYLTGYPTVTSSFYHWSSLQKELEARTSLGLQGLETLLRKNQVKYLFVQDDWLYWEVLYKWHQRDTGEFIREDIKNGKPAKIFEIQKLEKYGWVQLFLSSKKFEGLFENLFQAQFPVPHFYKRVLGWELKEANPLLDSDPRPSE